MVARLVVGDVAAVEHREAVRQVLPGREAGEVVAATGDLLALRSKKLTWPFNA